MSDPGIYLVNSTGEMTPLATESGVHDLQLLADALRGNGIRADLEHICELCSQDHTARFRDDEDRAVCGVHANALMEGSWDGDVHEVNQIPSLD